jgi:hypothetical protein
MGRLVYAGHSEHSLLWPGAGAKPCHIFDILPKQEQQLKNKTTNKATGHHQILVSRPVLHFVQLWSVLRVPYLLHRFILCPVALASILVAISEYQALPYFSKTTLIIPPAT